MKSFLRHSLPSVDSIRLDHEIISTAVDLGRADHKIISTAIGYLLLIQEGLIMKSFLRPLSTFR